jgi:glutamate dehydrogenase
MNDREFLQNKDAYVQGVLKILEKRAVDESETIFRRHKISDDKRLYTDISNEISYEINELTDAVYTYLTAHPEKLEIPAYVKVLLFHFPEFVQERKKFRDRIKGLPFKYRVAMVSSEIATQSVYHGGFDAPFEEKLDHFVRKVSRGLSA